jgi:hypothetical protein
MHLPLVSHYLPSTIRKACRRRRTQRASDNESPWSGALCSDRRQGFKPSDRPYQRGGAFPGGSALLGLTLALTHAGRMVWASGDSAEWVRQTVAGYGGPPCCVIPSGWGRAGGRRHPHMTGMFERAKQERPNASKIRHLRPKLCTQSQTSAINPAVLHRKCRRS